MSAYIWGSSDDGLFDFVSVTSETLKDSVSIIRYSFLVEEKVCSCVELSRYSEAVEEFEKLCVIAARDGVSIAAKEKVSGKVVEVLFNRLQVKARPSYFEQYTANCKHPSTRAVIQFMNDAEAIADLFDLCKGSCLLELMFASTLPSSRGKGIARKLIEYSVELGKALLSGKNVKVGLDVQALPLEPIPIAASCILTSGITQYITKQLGFIKAAEIHFEKAMFEGKSFASQIGPKPPSATVEYKLL